MNQSVADSVRHLRRVVISDTYKLALDADILVAADAAWWLRHPEAKKFAGEKFCITPVAGVKLIRQVGVVRTSVNSGLAALHVAIIHGAQRVLLFGLDLHVRNGLHWFGEHKLLRNPTATRMKVFCGQFEQYAKKQIPAGVQVFNCTPGSDLKCFPFSTLDEQVTDGISAAA